MDLVAGRLVLRIRNGVEQEQLVDDAVVDAIDGRAGKHAVGRAGEHFLRAADLDDGLGSAAQAAGRVDHVIEQQAGLALDVADDVHDLGAVGLLAALVHDGQAQTHLHGERARTRNAADIRRDDDQILAAVAEAAQIVAGEQRRAVEVVDRDVKEALDLRCVQVHGQHTVSTGDGQQVRH